METEVENIGDGGSALFHQEDGGFVSRETV